MLPRHPIITPLPLRPKSGLGYSNVWNIQYNQRPDVNVLKQIISVRLHNQFLQTLNNNIANASKTPCYKLFIN